MLRSTMLARHNAARAAIGLTPLVWSEGLARSAHDHATVLSRTGRFAHAAQQREGENLFTGTKDAYSYTEMADLWIAERRNFVNAPAPGFSRTGRPGDVTHYAQIVWRSTQAVGCALVSGARDDVLVCRYAPRGNMAGQRAY